MSDTRCPACGKPVDLERAIAPPFCSSRCRQIDLGRWLDEKNSITIERSEEHEVADRPDDRSS